jgi:glutamate racemase
MDNEQAMHNAKDRAELPIGVFDSGVGGLTVFAAIGKKLPGEHLVYLGDTARLPYGTKSAATVSRYSVQAASQLVERGVKMLVIACNTATAAGLPDLQRAFPHIPVIGVVEPGARAACRASQKGKILVIATEATIRQQAYQNAIHALRPDFEVIGLPCQLFVAIAEEGWTGNNATHDPAKNREEGAILEAMARRYFGHHFQNPETQPDCLLLGCTHFPPLATAIRRVTGNHVQLMDSAETTAEAVAEDLTRLGIMRNSTERGRWQFLTTDLPERFCRVGSQFLGAPINPDKLELVVL